MLRLLLNLLSALSLLLCLTVCVFWFRGRTGSDELAWRYDRWLDDRSAASTLVTLRSSRWIWLGLFWGKAPPPTPWLTAGYYINADKSGGRPQLTFRHEGYDQVERYWPILPEDHNTSGRGPVRWQTGRRSRPTSLDDSFWLRVGVRHWLLAAVLAVPPALTARRHLVRRRRRARGLCPDCGYDLRASHDRCPECGTAKPDRGAGVPRSHARETRALQ